MSRGDHLFYYRANSLYSHHGICCGDGSVIHYESSPWMKMAAGRVPRTENWVPRIKRVSHDEFALGSKVFVRSYQVCDEPKVVLERAASRLGEAGYSLFENNCEHFAVWCKTGWPNSTQVDAHREAQRLLWKGIPLGASLLRTAHRVPLPYRGWAYAVAVAAAGTVYAGTYFAQRQAHRREQLS